MQPTQPKQENPKRSRKRIGVGVLTLLGISGLIYVVVAPRAIDADLTLVRRGKFQEVIKTDGKLRSKDRFIVSAFADGDIKRVDLKIGDPIKKGEKVTELYWDIKYEPVKSPITGVISKVFRESAGPIRRGEPIVEVVDPEKLEVVVDLLTTDAARVSPKNPVKITGWGGETAIQGEVVRVSKAGFTKPSALGVEEERTEVTVDLKNVKKGLLSKVGSNFHVDVEIIISSQEGALVVPIGAVFRSGSEWAVYQVLDDHARLKPIQIVRRGSDEVMIEKGLVEGDQIILYPSDLIKDGNRIREMKSKTSTPR
jgi:HlyD family secretion protein